MGLDISHDAWHGAYSSFSRWRNELARVAGYWVAPLTYDDGVVRPSVIIDWGHIPQGALHGRWDTEPGDALMYLITHSDCEGSLSPARARRLADRLEELLPLLPAEDDAGHIGNWRDKTQAFIDGCRLAHSKRQKLRFF